MKYATAIGPINATDAGQINRPRSLIYSSLSPEQNQIVAAAQRKLSLAARTAGGKLAVPASRINRPKQAALTTQRNSQCFWCYYEV